MTEQRFRQFYESTYAPLWAYLARVGGDHHLAEDVAQEAYVRLLRSPSTPDSEDELRKLLYTVALNILRDHWRRARRIAEWTEQAASGGEPSTAPDEETGDIAAALEKLPPQQRSLLWLAYVEGYEHREIARMTSLAEKSIKVLLFRARKRLADVLHRMGFDTEVKR